jgi:hypothetical protein
VFDTKYRHVLLTEIQDGPTILDFCDCILHSITFKWFDWSTPNLIPIFGQQFFAQIIFGWSHELVLLNSVDFVWKKMQKSSVVVILPPGCTTWVNVLILLMFIVLFVKFFLLYGTWAQERVVLHLPWFSPHSTAMLEATQPSLTYWQGIHGLKLCLNLLLWMGKLVNPGHHITMAVKPAYLSVCVILFVIDSHFLSFYYWIILLCKAELRNHLDSLLLATHCSRGGKAGGMRSCKQCRGVGFKTVLRNLRPGIVQQMQVVCPDCHGAGGPCPLFLVLYCVKH